MTMPQLSDHFTWEELAVCRHCGRHCPHRTSITYLALKLEDLRFKMGNRPIVVTSGWRCAERQIELYTAARRRGLPATRGGLHSRGLAADLRVPAAEQPQWVAPARDAGFAGIELTDDHLHLDLRPVPWFADRRTKKEDLPQRG